MFNKIIFILKNGLVLEDRVIENIKEITRGIKISFLSFKEISKKDLAKADLVITIGGDGTFVRTANLIEDSLILGINSEPNKSEGALTSLNIQDIGKLRGIIAGKFKIKFRNRAKAKLNGRILDEYATNEVFIGTASQFHTSLYKIRFKDEEEEHKSSGIIISTGTGSKAWYLSAGGKPFAPEQEKLAFIIREPYLGERVFRPKIINGEIRKGEKLVIESKRDFGGILAINNSVYDFNKGDKAEIELSDKPLKVVEVIEK